MYTDKTQVLIKNYSIKNINHHILDKSEILTGFIGWNSLSSKYLTVFAIRSNTTGNSISEKFNSNSLVEEK